MTATAAPGACAARRAGRSSQLRSRAPSAQSCRTASLPQPPSASPAPPSRRAALLALVAAPVALTTAPPASAEDVYVRFYGAAAPPATYGGVGGTTAALARYSFELPVGAFKEDAVSKVDKGSIGVDVHFSSVPARKKEEVFLISLRNEGSHGGAGFALSVDTETALKTVSGGSYPLQDAIENGSVTATVRPDGVYSYDLEGPTCAAIALTTSADGRLFGLFVLAPAAAWEADKTALRRIRDSLEVYKNPSAFA